MKNITEFIDNIINPIGKEPITVAELSFFLNNIGARLTGNKVEMMICDMANSHHVTRDTLI